jgi:hypothetical protein
MSSKEVHRRQRLMVRASLLSGVRDPRPPRPKGGRRA